MRYVIDNTVPFEGTAISLMPDNIHCAYDGATIEEMRVNRKNPNLVAVTGEEIDKLYKEYLDRLNQSEFTEIDRERYYDLYDCLPPARNMSSMFFVGEPHSGKIFPFCFTIGGRYFQGLRSIYLSEKELRTQIEEHWQKVKDKQHAHGDKN